MKTTDLLKWCDEYLQSPTFSDYAPNGLQVEGKEEISKIVCAVTASSAAIEAAVEEKADALLVHHGYFWKSEPVPITGWKKNRIEKLLKHQINLIAYHLPLDAHSVVGNNNQLAEKLDWIVTQPNTPNNFLTEGCLEQKLSLAQLCMKIADRLNHIPVVIGKQHQIIKKIAWCSGGGQSYFQDAIALGVDCFITGEISESQFHLSNETGVAFIGAGHHATEQFGVQALGNKITEQFGLPYLFFNENNPG